MHENLAQKGILKDSKEVPYFLNQLSCQLLHLMVLNAALFGCFACQKEKEKKCDALLTAGTVFSTPAALTLAAIRCYAAAMDTLLSATCYTHTHTWSREGKTNTQRDEK